MSSLLGVGVIGTLYDRNLPEKTPSNVQKAFQAGVSMEKMWISVSAIVDIALIAFSFTHGGFWGLLGTTSGALDLGLNYDTWKACENGEKIAEKSDTFTFIQEKNPEKQEQGVLNLIRKISENTIFWKAVIRVLEERMFSTRKIS